MENNILQEDENNIVKNTDNIIKESDTDNNILSNDKINVGIRPDVKDNVVPIQLCSCSLSLIFNCFTKNTNK
jgi:hypothetical protein